MTLSTNTASSVDMPSLIADRIERVRAYMRDHDLDHLVLQTFDNIRYVSNFRSLIINETADHILCIFNSDGTADIYGPHLNEAVASPDSSLPNIKNLRPLAGWTPLMTEPETVIQSVTAELQAAGARRIGYDAVHPVLLRGLQDSQKKFQLQYVGDELFSLRREKLPAEISLMKLAHRDNLDALEAAFAIAKVGITDRELLANSLAFQQKHNGEILTHSTCNVHAKPWRWFPERHEARAGEAIFIDQVYYGLGGYASDITRTVAVQEAYPEVAKAYAKLVEASHDLHTKARTGASVADLDDYMNEILVKQGLQPSPYGLGHGIGLRVMEPPSIAPRHLLDNGGGTLIQGEVIAIEPETAIELNGELVLLKVEDCFVVQSDGLEPLGDTAPTEMRVVGN